jgi:phage tail-like protein
MLRAMTQSTGTRAYAAAHFALELDQKKDVGLFKSIEGGGMKTDLIKYQNGGQHPTFFRLGKPKYEDIKLQVGMAMSEPFFKWVESFFTGQPVRKTGAIVAADFYYKERARREFDQAMITEVAFPKLDGNDKGACYMNVTISPETVTYKPGSNQPITQPERARTQKLWAACNFDFSLDGFADSCHRVTKVDAFTIKQKPIEYNAGMQRAATKVPGRLEYPNITFYIPEADAEPFVAHHMKHTGAGTVQPDARLHGEINTYDNQGTRLFKLEFFGSDIFNITHDKSDASSEEMKQVKIELCVEKMTFEYAAAPM